MGPPPPPDDDRTCRCCGAELSARATFCRNCGASEECGWRDDEDDLDLPAGYSAEDDFDYDEFVADEFPEASTAEHAAATWRSFCTAVIFLLCLALLATSLRYVWQ